MGAYCAAVVAALCLDSRAALPQPAKDADEHVDRIVGMAMAQYDTHHHAISDTFDKVDPHLLALDTVVMAVAAYRLANAPDAPGRRLSTTAATRLLEKLGLESLRRAVYEPGDPK